MKSSRSTPLANTLDLKALRNLSAALAITLATASASAQTLYWNPSGTGNQPSDGNGNLTGATTWWSGSSNVQWSNNYNAFIGVVGSGSGNSYTLTNNGANWSGFQVNQLVFQGAASYTLSGNPFNVRDGIRLDAGVTGVQRISANVSFGRSSTTSTSITNNSANGILALSSANYLAANNAATGGSLSFGGTGAGTNLIEGSVRQNGAGAVNVDVTGSRWLFSGNNTHLGGTQISGGVAILGSASTFAAATGDFIVDGGALQSSVADSKLGGDLTLISGSIEINTSGTGSLTIASGKNFTMEDGVIHIALGSSYDQFISEGSGIFTISGGSILLDVTGSGFSYESSYAIFSGFTSGSIVGLDIQGYDSNRYTAVLSNSGVLSFTAIPEPAAFAQVGALVLVVLFLLRKRIIRR